MKKSFLINLFAALAMLLSSCGGNAPEDVTESFRKALLKADKEAAAKISTEHMKSGLPLAIALATDEKIIKILSEPLDKFDMQSDSGKIESESMYYALKKIDGKWLIDNVQLKVKK